MKSKFILVLSTDATRTGTPILLLDTLNWINSNSDYKFLFILQDGGVLINDFQKLGKVYLWKDIISFGTNKYKELNFLFNIVKKFIRLDDRFLSKLFIRCIQFRFNIVLTYNNTARNGYFLKIFGNSLKTKILTNVHEGLRILDLFNAKGFVDLSLSKSDAIITVSNSVKNVLISKFNISKFIDVIPGGVNVIDSSSFIVNDVRNELQINNQSKIVLCCGWLHWHKGIDFFLQLVFKHLMIDKNVVFIWLGGESDSNEYKQLIFDIEKLNLVNNVRLVPNRDDIHSFYSVASVVLVLSREESFSLVTVEAGLHRKPILCFDKSGGPCEIVDYDSRFLVPYGNIDILSSRLSVILNSQEESTLMGDYLNRRVLDNYTVNLISNRILDKINDMIEY